MWPSAITRLTTHFSWGVALCINWWFASIENAYMVIHDTKFPYWDQVSLHNTKLKVKFKKHNAINNASQSRPIMHPNSVFWFTQCPFLKSMMHSTNLFMVGGDRKRKKTLCIFCLIVLTQNPFKKKRDVCKTLTRPLLNNSQCLSPQTCSCILYDILFHNYAYFPPISCNGVKIRIDSLSVCYF